MVNRDLVRLKHMLESIQAIIKFSQNRKRKDLDSDRFFASAVVRELEIIGEASCKISAEMKLRFPEIPWKEMVGMRNRLIHAYFDINHDIVWSTIEKALPNLEHQIKTVISLNNS